MGELFAFFFAAYLNSAPLGATSFETFPRQYFAVAPPAEDFGDFAPVITASAGEIVDVASGTEIWGKHETDVRAFASLTKLMTALIILENHDFSETVTVPSEATTVEGAQMYLAAGEKISVGNLMRGLLIPSANDAAVALAIFHSGSEEKFVEEMNLRAHFLEMDATHFVNVHGLDTEGHVSTATDLSILARKVLEFSEVRTITNTRQQTVSSVDGRFKHDLKTTNQLLDTSLPVFGLKTGTTDLAGQCLITLARKDGREILIIVLGSTDRFGDTKALLAPFLL